MIKKIVLLAVLSSYSLAHAEEQLMSDSGSSRLARLLGGMSLVCGLSDDAKHGLSRPGTYPVSIRATSKPGGQTLLSIRTQNPSIGFGYGGEEIDPVEITRNWIILGIGDDGRRHVYINSFVAAERNILRCSRDSRGKLSGDIPGVVGEIWNSGNIESYGVQCCLE